MVHHYLEGLENEWVLIRETPSSSKFRVETPFGWKLVVDIHFTAGKMLTANLFPYGKSGEISKGDLTPVMDDIGRLGLKRQDYAVIDYTLCQGGNAFDGNFSINESHRKHYAYRIKDA